MLSSCDRLDKICQPTKSKRQLKSYDGVRNSRVEKSRPDVDVSRLEHKLDQLVAQLKGQHQSLASPSNSDVSTLIPSPVHVGCCRCCCIVAPNEQRYRNTTDRPPSYFSPMTFPQQKPKSASCALGKAMRDSFRTSVCLGAQESYNETNPLFGRVLWRYLHDSRRSSMNE
jgi:hypothetical protein